MQDNLFCEGNHPKARWVGRDPKRGQKLVRIFHWDIGKKPEENLALYDGEPVVKVHRWWGGSEHSVEYGNAQPVAVGYAGKHVAAIESTGALIIANRMFCSLFLRRTPFLLDDGYGFFVPAELPELDPKLECVGWHGVFSERVYLLSADKLATLEMVVKDDRKSKSSKPVPPVFEEEKEETPSSSWFNLNKE